jgi:glycosyltransferase involved in cell wall biosynthesis
LVFPSLLETFGHPLLEAMVARTPIVVSDIPAFRDVAGDTAVYFDPRDPKALARAVDSLLSDPRRPALSEAAPSAVQ